MNIESLSIEQLADLRDKVILTLNDRVSAKEKELQQEIERFRSLASSKIRNPTTVRSTKPKYQKGDQSWSGRGTSPAWVKQQRALGGMLDEFKSAPVKGR